MGIWIGGPAPGTYAPVSKGALGNRGAFLGDSTTVGGDSATVVGDSWPGYAALLSMRRIRYVVNAGVAGNTSAQILARVQTDVIPYTPTFCTVMAGTNDVNTGVPFATYTANMVAIITALRTAGITPVLCTICPKPSQRAGVSKTNAWIKRYASAQGIALIDFNALLTDPATGGFLAAYDAGDGTHPNAAGYAAMGQIAVDTLAPYLPPMAPQLPVENVDGSNLLTNGLFLNDANADGVPDQWAAAGGSTGFTHSIVNGDTAIKGNWAQFVLATAASQRFLEQDITTGFASGDRLLLVGRISAAGLAGGSKPTVYLRFYNGTVNTDYRPVSNTSIAISSGVFAMEQPVPAGTTAVKILLAGGAGSGTYKFAQLGLYNLTALGIS